MTEMTESQKVMIWNILSVFETGKVEGDYGSCSVLADGAGISYGKHQATDKSGSVDAIVLRYLDLGGARSSVLRPLLPLLEEDVTTKLPTGKNPDEVASKPSTLPKATFDNAIFLMRTLASLGTDLAMKVAQDQVFAERYWNPCRSQCQAMGLQLPLSWCAVYDTCIQSGPAAVSRMRRMFPASPPSSGGEEKRWATEYLQARKRWIESFTDASPSKQSLVRSTSYRANSLLALVSAGNWMLNAPVQIERPKVTIW